MSAKYTPGPWPLGEYSDTAGYDCMTGGVRAGPAVLDGRDYGQKRIADIEPEALARMMADARLIAAAPEMLAQHESSIVDLEFLLRAIEEGDPKPELLIRVKDILRRSREAIAKAEAS